MKVKYILSFPAKELPEMKKAAFPVSTGGETEDIIAGIELHPDDFSPSLYEELSAAGMPYVLLLDLASAKEGATNGQIRKTADYLFPLLLDPAYLKHLTEKVIFVKSAGPAGEVVSSLKKSFGNFGLHNIKIIGYQPGTTHEEVSELNSLADLKLPSAPEYLNIPGDRWLIFRTHSRQAVADHTVLAEKIKKHRDSDLTIRRQDAYTDMQVENRQLKDTIAILNKNIYDLNNYYRYVRGEIMFKHHNRDEQKDNPISGAGQKGHNFSGLFPADLSDKGKYQSYYKSMYESLPAIYKKMATLVKIITGRRELFYYLSKKHKKAFLEFVRSLPEEKQVQVWYYYEYEILPGWYKKIGKLLARK